MQMTERVLQLESERTQLMPRVVRQSPLAVVFRGALVALCITLGEVGGLECVAQSGQQHYRWRGELRTEDGSWITLNPGRPLLTSEELDVEQVWQFDGGPVLWENPRHLTVSQGYSYILDVMARKVHVVTPDGGTSISFGRPGGGPGELKQPYDLASVGDLLVVGDAGTASLEVYMRETGAYENTIPVRTVSGFRLSEHRDGVVVTGMGQGWFAVSGSSQYRFENPEFWKLGPPGEDNCNRLGADAGLVFRWNCLIPEVEIWSDAGAVGFISVDRKPEQLSESDREALRRRMTRSVASVGYEARRVNQLVNQFMSLVGAVKRPMQSVEYDSVMNQVVLLEQAPEEQGAGPGVLHFFSDHGIYVAELEMGAPIADFDVDGGDIWALVEDTDTGLMYLRRFRVHYPPGLIQYISGLFSGEEGETA
jgi:hypothetical protein